MFFFKHSFLIIYIYIYKRRAAGISSVFNQWRKVVEEEKKRLCFHLNSFELVAAQVAISLSFFFVCVSIKKSVRDSSIESSFFTLNFRFYNVLLLLGKNYIGFYFQLPYLPLSWSSASLFELIFIKIAVHVILLSMWMHRVYIYL